MLMHGVLQYILTNVDDCLDPQKSSPTQLQPLQPLQHYIIPLSITKSTMPPKSQDQADDKRQAAREVIDILQEISDLLVRAHLHQN